MKNIKYKYEPFEDITMREIALCSVIFNKSVISSDNPLVIECYDGINKNASEAIENLPDCAKRHFKKM